MSTVLRASLLSLSPSSAAATGHSHYVRGALRVPGRIIHRPRERAIPGYGKSREEEPNCVELTSAMPLEFSSRTLARREREREREEGVPKRKRKRLAHERAFSAR